MPHLEWHSHQLSSPPDPFITYICPFSLLICFHLCSWYIQPQILLPTPFPPPICVHLKNPSQRHLNVFHPLLFIIHSFILYKFVYPSPLSVVNSKSRFPVIPDPVAPSSLCNYYDSWWTHSFSVTFIYYLLPWHHILHVSYMNIGVSHDV